MTGLGACLGGLGALVDGDPAPDGAPTYPASALAAAPVGAGQVAGPLRGTGGRGVDPPVDRLGAHPHGRLIRVVHGQARSDRAWGPAGAQGVGDVGDQMVAAHTRPAALAGRSPLGLGLGVAGHVRKVAPEAGAQPGGTVGGVGVGHVAHAAPAPVDLAGDGRGSPPQAPGDDGRSAPGRACERSHRARMRSVACSVCSRVQHRFLSFPWPYCKNQG